MGKAHIGSSGWRYAPWRGKFYPADLRQSDEVHHASRQFDSIEINRTFYSLQRSESFAYRYAQTPRGFVFAVKRPRYITHASPAPYRRGAGEFLRRRCARPVREAGSAAVAVSTQPAI